MDASELSRFPHIHMRVGLILGVEVTVILSKVVLSRLADFRDSQEVFTCMYGMTTENLD
jgi:hypothetical protein